MVNKEYNIAVVGATGNVGREVLTILEERKFPIKNIYALASLQSSGKKVSMSINKQITVSDLAVFDFAKYEIDIAFFCAGSEVSKKYIPEAVKAGCICIDKSSLFRMDKDVPLVVPEVNPEALKTYNSNIIATPNCTTIPLVSVLKPLDDKYKIKRVVITTFQSVSGTGKKAMDELFNQTKGYFEAAVQNLENDNLNGEVYPKQIAFNCIPQCDDFVDDGYTKEEYKIINETCKILGREIPITATCVRVPVFRCHAESVNIEFENDFDVEELSELLEDQENIVVHDRREKGGYATQCENAGTDCVFVSRIRKDNSIKNAVNLWIVCDNLRKGSALNGVQIAEKIIENDN